MRLPEDDHLIRPDAADHYGLDYLALGHWHKRSLHKSADGVERTAYSGTHEPMGFPGANADLATGWSSFSADGDAERFRDDGHGIALLVTIAAPKAPPGIEAIDIGRLHWRAEQRDVTGQSLGSLISDYSGHDSPELTILRLTLAGVMDPQGHARIEELRQIVHNRFHPGSSMDADGVLIEPSTDQLAQVVGTGVLKRVLDRLKADVEIARRDRQARGRTWAEAPLSNCLGGTTGMILEGFEIDNWSCIKKLTVSGLPPTGVIVLHGPNRTGKSSLVQALCACLMDYPSTTNALKSCYPRGRDEKPIVSVRFSAGGTTYRIKKCFGSNKSELATRTSTGDWKVEANTAAEAHARVCACAGGDDSSKGLHQLLWLTQAEFQLPEAKKFDADIQAKLRGILGVLQTPLDDRFIERVKKRWNVWYSGQRKAEKQQKLKEGCNLAESLSKLARAREQLTAIETTFGEVEGLLRQTSDLETRKVDLQAQLKEQKNALSNYLEERERSQARIAARKLAAQRDTNAQKEQQAALDEQSVRAEASKRLKDDGAPSGQQSRRLRSRGKPSRPTWKNSTSCKTFSPPCATSAGTCKVGLTEWRQSKPPLRSATSWKLRGGPMKTPGPLTRRSRSFDSILPTIRPRMTRPSSR